MRKIISKRRYNNCTCLCTQHRSSSINKANAAAAKSLQSCPTLSDSMDCSLPGSSVHGIFQARVLEWGATAFSRQMLTPIKKKKKEIDSNTIIVDDFNTPLTPVTDYPDRKLIRKTKLKITP